MNQGDYSSAPYNYPYSLPNLQNLSLGGSTVAADNHHPNPYASASAPPVSSSFAPADYPSYAPNYPPYPQNPDSIPPPTAPSFAPNPSPNMQASYNPTAQPAPTPTSQSSSFNSYDLHGQYQSPAPQQPRHQPGYPPFDQHQAASNYAPPPASSVPPPNPSPNPNSSYTSTYSSAPYGHVGSSVLPIYDMPYDNSPKFDHAGSYFSDRYDAYSRNRSDYASDFYGKRPENNVPSQYDLSRDDGYADGVYAYTGKAEPYGARGTVPKSSTSTLFDDYGRPIGTSSARDPPKSSAKIVRAVPKADTQQDVKSGVQKFRVKLLPESGSQSAMDVLCQIALDGIRMLDPSTSRTLRIYPLENITRCEVADSSTLAFWSKSPVDIEPRRIRLRSNSYTTNTLLDTVTAATVQIKEMGGRSKPADTKTTEQPAEKKKGLADWVSFIKPPNEEKDHWVPDEAVSKCTACETDFGAFVRRHHCRNCGDIFCDRCTSGRMALTAEENAQPVRVCDRCMAEVTQRLTNAKEAASRSASFQSHEDLAKKLQEEMEKNRRASSGSKSDGSGRRMKEVACPICTVHLQVQVPTSGSETIECGVCQHPFLVSAH